ncbi:hypothetical protein D3C75_1280100 [compost metagenome]
MNTQPDDVLTRPQDLTAAIKRPVAQGRTKHPLSSLDVIVGLHLFGEQRFNVCLDDAECQPRNTRFKILFVKAAKGFLFYCSSLRSKVR